MVKEYLKRLAEKKIFGAVMALLLALFACSAQPAEAAAQRVALLPAMVVNSDVDRDDVALVNSMLQREMHVPLNEIVKKVEAIPAADAQKALEQGMTATANDKGKVQLKQAVAAAGQAVDADLFVLPVIRDSFQWRLGSTWDMEIIILVHANVDLYVYNRGDTTVKPYRANRYYRGEESTSNTLGPQLQDCMYEIFNEAKLNQKVNN